tara:strand:+ start:457 stop:642 length:186 start_codon:yes stop_codon:yes gene_type:complete
MSDTQSQITEQYEIYIDDNAKFTESGNKAAGTRARKALATLMKLAKDRRKEIQETKNAAKV